MIDGEWKEEYRPYSWEAMQCLSPESVRNHLDGYDRWLTASSVPFYHRRSLSEMLYQWEIKIRFAKTQEQLDYVNHSITLSWAYARGLEEKEIPL
jgi:hypothetical protein